MERHRVGIMQGRLSPTINGKEQSFPSASWREEFALAAECEFELLEWVFDAADWKRNPLVTAEGRTELFGQLEAVPEHSGRPTCSG